MYIMKILFNKEIYLDNASATPINKEVLKVMNRVEKSLFANPSSIHDKGVEVRNIIEESRGKIAKLINAHSDEIIFTGSGTESDALAIIGVVNEFKKNNKNTENKLLPHIVITSIEHHAVLENCKLLEERGEAEVTYVEAEENGIVNPKDIKKALKENTILVSVMYANNEIGTIQPVQEIAKEIRHYRKEKNKSCKECSFGLPWETDEASTRNFSPEKYPWNPREYSCKDYFLQFPIFHTDACQAMNYLETENIEKLGVDLLSFNGSKIYGPKGIGILYKKRSVKLEPVYGGGGQEFGLRSGTENIVSIAGVAKAFEITEKMKNKESERLTKIRDYGIDKLLSLKNKTGYEIILNGDRKIRIPNNINISIPEISSELLVIELSAKGIYVSEKSACQSKDGEGRTLRISLGRFTIKSDMDYMVSSLEKILRKYKGWK